MRSIKFFFIVLAGIILLSLALRLLFPFLLIGLALGGFMYVARRIRGMVHPAYVLSPARHRAPLDGFWSEPLYPERERYHEPLTDVHYIEVK